MTQSTETPKRTTIVEPVKRSAAALRYLLMLLLALVLFGIILLLSGKNPIQAYRRYFSLHPGQLLRLFGSDRCHGADGDHGGGGGHPLPRRSDQCGRGRTALYGRLPGYLGCADLHAITRLGLAAAA